MARRFPSAKYLALKLLGLYRFTAVLRRPSCRFYPTCSKYAAESIEVHGLVRGLYLTMKRLWRCHPYHPGGIDEVPAEFRWTCAGHRRQPC